MRFYDPTTNPPERLDSKVLFPNADEASGARRCLSMGLLPSVTTVLHSIREDYLEQWLMREAVSAGRNSEGSPSEVVEALLTKESPNAAFGTNVHACVEHHLLNKPAPDVDKDVLKHAEPVLSWLDKNVKEVLFSELVLADVELGTAGSVDLGFVHQDGRFVVGDLKVVKFSKKFPPKPGLGYKAQLSAYKQMLESSGRFGPVDFHRLSIYAASKFGWDKAPDLRLFWHNKCHLGTFRAVRDVWHAQVMQCEPDMTAINPNNLCKTTLPNTGSGWTPKR